MIPLNKKPKFIISDSEKEWNFKNKDKCKYIVRWDKENERGFVTRINEDGSETFCNWEPLSFRQLIKELFNVDVK